MIVSAKWQNTANTEVSITLDSGEEWFGITVNHRFWQNLQDWIALGNTPNSADPAPSPPTNDEIYNQVIQNQKVLKAVVLSLNDGTLVPGANISNATLKAIVKANM